VCKGIELLTWVDRCALNERIASIARRTRAHCDVILDGAIGHMTALVGAWVRANVVHAVLVVTAVNVVVAFTPLTALQWVS
jgi:hypothetical protein